MGGIEKKKKKSKTFFYTQRKTKKKPFESNPPRHRNLWSWYYRRRSDRRGLSSAGWSIQHHPLLFFFTLPTPPEKRKKKEERKSSLAAAQEPRTDGPRLGCAGRRVVNCGAACQFHKKARPFKLLISRSCVRVCCECVYACVVDVCMYQCVCVNGAWLDASLPRFSDLIFSFFSSFSRVFPFRRFFFFFYPSQQLYLPSCQPAASPSRVID